MLKIELMHLPMPPSDNGLFRDARIGKGRTRRVLAAPYRQWLKAMETEHLKSRLQIYKFSRAAQGKVITIEIQLMLPLKTFYTTTKAAKDPLQCYDASNRVKAICDWFASAIGIDDRYFTSVLVFKTAYQGLTAPQLNLIAHATNDVSDLRKALNI